jgi:hypothetical protein
MEINGIESRTRIADPHGPGYVSVVSYVTGPFIGSYGIYVFERCRF